MNTRKKTQIYLREKGRDPIMLRYINYYGRHFTFIKENGKVFLEEE